MVSFRIPGFGPVAKRGRGGSRASEGGFTLIELMVAMSVMAIIMAIAIPSVATYMALQEIRGSAQEVVDVLRDARDSAVNEGAPRYVEFIPGDPGSYQVKWYDDASSDWIQETPVVPLHETVSFSNADVNFPLLVNRPETGELVPENAAYFDTRGHYPFGVASTFSITLHGGMDRSETITLHTQTGQVTWE
jgi:prepilin-type N-terminal cleavage/methylation domain-containing protein